MTNSELKSKAKTALVWSFLESVGLRGVQFIVGVILARLLLPEQFGLIGMLSIFIGISQTLLSSGFGAALIQKKEVTPADSSSVFYFNVLISFALVGLLYLAAPWISAFFNEPILKPMLRVLSLVILINSFALIQTTLLTRDMNFKTQTQITLAASVLSGVVGIGMAVYGFGVWSLVMQQISLSVFRAGMLWGFNPWRPNLFFSFRSLRTMFRYGSRIMASGILNQIFENIHNLVIGKFFTPAVLGFYSRAKRLEELPTLTVSNIIARVSFPVFASIQDDNERLKRAFRKALMLLSLINAPVMIGLAAVARPLVAVLLTEKWLPCVPYLQLLCVAGLLFPIHVLNLNILMAKGHSDLFLRLEIIKKVLVVISIAIAWRWGVAALIGGQIAVSVISFFLNTYYTNRLLKYGPLDQLHDISVYFVFAVVMGAGVYAMEFLSFPHDAVQLVVQVVLGLTLCGLLWFVFRPPAFVEGWQDVRQRIPFLKKHTLQV